MPKARITKLFTGRGKTRPIPRVVDASDRLAARVTAAQQTPRSSPVQAALGPRVDAGPVLGTRVSNGKGANAGVYNPGSVNGNV